MTGITEWIRKVVVGVAMAWGQLRAFWVEPEVEGLRFENIDMAIAERFPFLQVDWKDSPNESMTTTPECWAEILNHLLVDRRKYVKDLYDCDNFAEALSADISRHYGLNAKLYVQGDSPLGYHAWNIIVAIDEAGDHVVFQVEPQTGEIDPEGYDPRRGYRT